MESPLAPIIGAAITSLGVVIQLMASGRHSVSCKAQDIATSVCHSIPSMFSSGKDLVTARKFTRMNTFPLLGLADAMSSRSEGDGKRNLCLCSSASHGGG